MNILVTGAAGFIGSALARTLLQLSPEITVIGVDNFDPYYPRTLKEFRLVELLSHPRFHFYEGDICSLDVLAEIFSKYHPQRVVHTAAQVGVSNGERHPAAYARTNVLGLTMLLEKLTEYQPEHLVFFSSSSVYGRQTKGVKKSLSEKAVITTRTPLSVYGITKAAGEALVQNWSQVTGVPATIIRPFSVYGPAGRPDMLPIIALRAARTKTPLKLFTKGGQIARDWTYIDDLVKFVAGFTYNSIPHSTEIINIGSGTAIALPDWISLFETHLKRHGLSLSVEHARSRGFESQFNQADITKACTLGYRPQTSVAEGLGNTVDFFMNHPELV